MTPIDDTRPFALVLRDWMARHQLTYDGAAAVIGCARGVIRNGLSGAPVRYERALRALMTLVDEGRV